MKKNLLSFAGTLICASLLTTAAQAECGDVTITEMDWESSAVVTAVSKFILEQGYGCNVTVVPSATTPAMTSVAENNKPDIITEVWINSAPAYPGLVEDGKVVTATDVLSDGGEEGWWIPNYLLAKHPELATLEGILANPNLVSGRFHNCPDGWGCHVINESLFNALDMENKGFEHFVHGSGETLATSLASAYLEEKPWFGYYWAPTPLMGKYPMTRIDIAPFNQAAYDCAGNPECADKQPTNFPVSKVVTGVTRDFVENEPEAFALMQKLSFTNQTMGTLLAWQESNQASTEEVAVYFLTKYQDVWTSWLNDTAKSNLGTLLN